MEENLWATLHRYRSLYLAKDISFLQTHSKNISTPPGYHVRDVLLSNIVFSHSYNFVALFSLTRLLYVLVQVNRGSQWVTNFQAQKIRAPAHCRTLRISKQDWVFSKHVCEVSITYGFADAAPRHPALPSLSKVLSSLKNTHLYIYGAADFLSNFFLDYDEKKMMGLKIKIWNCCSCPNKERGEQTQTSN